jgi:hypothetical protein
MKVIQGKENSLGNTKAKYATWAASVMLIGSSFCLASANAQADSSPLLSGMLLAQNSAVAAPIGQSTASTPLSGLSVPRIPVAINIISYNEVGEAAANRGQGEVESTNTFRATFKLDPNTSLRLNQDITNNWVNAETGTGKFGFLDPHIQIARSNIVKTEGGLTVNGFGRYIAPLSANSQRANSGGGVRLGVEVAQKLMDNKLTLAYNVIPQVNILNQTSFISSSGKLQGARKGALHHYAEVAYDFLPNLTVYTDLGLKHVDYMEDDRVTDRTGRDHSYLFANLAVSYTPVSFLELEFGISEDESRDLTVSENYFAIYREEDTAYYLQGRFMF